MLAPGYNEESDVTKVMCGDYNDRLKLLRFVSLTPMMFFWFKSDHSKAFSGLLASYSILQGGLSYTCTMCNTSILTPTAFLSDLFNNEKVSCSFWLHL